MRVKPLRESNILIVFMGLLFSTVLAQAQQLIVMSSGGFAPAYKLLAPSFDEFISCLSGAHPWAQHQAPSP
jgi:hypothetical protein